MSNIIKVGSWVEFIDLSNGNPKQVMKIKDGVVYTNNNKCLIHQCTVWNPIKGEVYVFWDDEDVMINGMPYYSIRVFDETSETNGFHFSGDNDKSEYWDNVAPLVLLCDFIQGDLNG